MLVPGGEGHFTENVHRHETFTSFNSFFFKVPYRPEALTRHLHHIDGTTFGIRI